MRVDEIERYLTREMSPEEQVHFEKEMEGDPSLKFDMQLIACVIRKTRAVHLYKEREMVSRMRQHKSRDRKRYVATLTVFFVSVATMVACLFFGIRAIIRHNQGEKEKQGVFNATSLPEREDQPAVYQYPLKQYDINGDRMLPDQFNSPYTNEVERGENYSKGNKNYSVESTIEEQPGIAHEDQSPLSSKSKEQDFPLILPETSQYEHSITEEPHEIENKDVERYLAIAIAGNGVWGGVERSFWTAKNNLQIDIVLNSQKQNTDIDEDIFRYKTHLITDAGKKKTLYDFRYGSTRRTSFFLEKGTKTHISLYFKGVRNRPTILRELRIPAIYDDFVFRNVTIN